MKICVPVERFNGMESAVFGHFGSAPMFALFNTETGELSVIDNRDEHHVHGACNPVMALGGNLVDAVIVGGIGRGALIRLMQSGIRVYRAEAASLGENIGMLQDRKLPEIQPHQTCGGHAHGGGCAH